MITQKPLLSIPMVLTALLFVFAGCNPDSDDTVSPAGSGTPTGGSNTGDHASFTLDGQPMSIPISGSTVMSVFGSSAQEDGIYQENQGTTVASITGPPDRTIYWARLKEIDVLSSPSGYPTNQQIDAMFQTTSYPYGKSINEVGAANSMDGVRVTYIGTDDVEWSTDKGSGDQTGSTFTIVSKTPLPNIPSPYGNYSILVQFSCKLYDGNGNVKNLTNGSMRGKPVLYY